MKIVIRANVLAINIHENNNMTAGGWVILVCNCAD